METRGRSHRNLAVAALLLGTGLGLPLGWLLLRQGFTLTPTEALCVGSWSFTSADTPTTLIVYDFAANRRLREEHYYLSSATPHLPRLAFVGRWRVDPDGRMVVERNGGVRGAFDTARGFVGELFDDGRQAWARPALTRFYWVEAVTDRGLQVRASRGGGKGQEEFTMHAFGASAVSPRISKEVRRGG